jgi:nucleoside-diphosphate-sugar epimerase
VKYLNASVRCKNDKFKNATGWQPKYPSFKQGYKTIVDERKNKPTQTEKEGW